MNPNLETGATLGAYRVESVLGRGGMGVVYLARDLRLDRRVALKVLSPDLANDAAFRERFTRESRMAASIDHPNIIPVYEAGDVGGVLYLAMRYVEGMDLRDSLLQGGPLSVERTLDVLRQVAAALDAAHVRGLVHRDIKPGNILLASGAGPESSDHAYLTDFGLTKRTQAETQLTAVGQFVGTIDYAAPEQITGRPIDGRTDQYSLGCVLYECLTGIVPFRRDSDVEVLFAHMSEPPPTLSSVRPDLPPELDHALARAMAKEKSERFATCSEFVMAAREAVHTSAAPVPSSPPPPPTLVGVPTEWVEMGRPEPPADTVAVEPAPPAPEPVSAPAQPQAVTVPPGPRRSEGSAGFSAGPVVVLGLIGAGAVLAAVLSSLTAGYVSTTFWNSWAVFSPLEGVPVLVAVAAVVIGLRSRRVSPSLAAGLLIGFGVLASVGCLSLLLFGGRIEVTTALNVVSLGAIAILLAGAVCARTLRAEGRRPQEPVALTLAVAGAALCLFALFQVYDGQSSLIDEWSEARDFVLEPGVAVAMMAVAIVVLAASSSRPFAAGLLLAIGGQSALHFAGLILASTLAIGEPGNTGAGGFVGVLGALLLAGAGVVSLRSSRRWSRE